MTEEQKQALIADMQSERLVLEKWRDDWNARDKINYHAIDIALATLANAIEPEIGALIFPEEMASEADGRIFYNKGWNACLAEVKRLNAPHTAPIEPICATGGEEWVKCCDGKPDIDVTVWCYGQYDDGSDDTDNYAFPGYMDKKGRWFACNNGDYVDGGYGNDYRACVARWMPLPAAPEAE